MSWESRVYCFIAPVSCNICWFFPSVANVYTMSLSADCLKKRISFSDWLQGRPTSVETPRHWGESQLTRGANQTSCEPPFPSCNCTMAALARYLESWIWCLKRMTFCSRSYQKFLRVAPQAPAIARQMSGGHGGKNSCYWLCFTNRCGQLHCYHWNC